MAKQRRKVAKYLQTDVPLRGAKLPPLGIPADLSQQAPNNSYGARLFYRDVEFDCVDCGVHQVWTAKQQQWWYEVAKGSIYAGAIRCRSCRAARRAQRSPTPPATQPPTVPGAS